MLRFAVLAIFFAAVCAGPITDESKSAKLDVLVVDSIDEYLAQNPEIKIIDEAETETLETEDRNHQRIYRFGQRVNGDRLVDNQNFANQWPTPQDVTLTLQYPQSGIGSIVSHVVITVQQSSNIGRAFIVAGGINQRSIRIMVEASRTTFVRYNAQIFGLN